MSISSDRGLDFERKVEKLTKRTLKIQVKRDIQSGAGLHKADLRDQFNKVPLFIECKDQATIKPKEWWRIADAKSSFGQAPVVVFPDNEEVLCTLRYSDLLNFIRESMDYQEVIDHLRQPITPVSEIVVPKRKTIVTTTEDGRPRYSSSAVCRNGHLADNYGYCQDKLCIFRRGYKAPKAKRGIGATR